jgi:hypothetical protein
VKIAPSLLEHLPAVIHANDSLEVSAKSGGGMPCPATQVEHSAAGPYARVNSAEQQFVHAHARVHDDGVILVGRGRMIRNVFLEMFLPIHVAQP